MSEAVMEKEKPVGEKKSFKHFLGKFGALIGLIILTVVFNIFYDKFIKL